MNVLKMSAVKQAVSFSHANSNVSRIDHGIRPQKVMRGQASGKTHHDVKLGSQFPNARAVDRREIHRHESAPWDL